MLNDNTIVMNSVIMIESTPVENFFSRDKERIGVATRVNTIIRGSMKKYLDNMGFLEINPVIISPISDPLNHPVDDPSINYYGHRYRLTKSMIFHKQLALVYLEKIYSFSPNIRIEPLERRSTGRHLAEFTQLDLEAKGKGREFVMGIAEGMINDAIHDVKRSVEDDRLNPNLHQYQRPFKKITYLDALKEYGDDFENVLSSEAKSPFWIVDIPLSAREFYDKEKEDGSGILLDMDLVYPYGFGEAISGGERENEYERILSRIKRKNQNPEEYSFLLQAAKIGLPASSGFGIGIERFVRFLTGAKSVSDVTLFPKNIGEYDI